MPALWPEIVRISGVATDFEADQMIFLIVRRRTLQVQRGHLLLFQSRRIARWRPDRFRPARYADRLMNIVLCDSRIYRAGNRWEYQRNRDQRENEDVHVAVSVVAAGAAGAATAVVVVVVTVGVALSSPPVASSEKPSPDAFTDRRLIASPSDMRMIPMMPSRPYAMLASGSAICQFWNMRMIQPSNAVRTMAPPIDAARATKARRSRGGQPGNFMRAIPR